MKYFLSVVFIIFLVSVGLWAFGDTPRVAVKHSVYFIGILIAVVVIIHIIALLGTLLILWLIDSEWLGVCISCIGSLVLGLANVWLGHTFPGIAHKDVLGIPSEWLLTTPVILLSLLAVFLLFRLKLGYGKGHR